MAVSKGNIYEFDRFRLEINERLLTRDGEPIDISAKAFDLLVALVENNGHLVEKETLYSRVWAGAIVEDANLTVQMSAIRKALGGDYIKTVKGHGYRFAADVRELNGQDAEYLVEQQTVSRVTVEYEIEPETEKREPVHKSLTTSPTLKVAALAIFAVALFIGGYYSWNGSDAQVSSTPWTNDVKSIAVLPFKNVEPDKENQLLGIGMADAVIAKLSHVKNIVVRQTKSVMRYAATTPEAVTVGREINVDAVLEGNIQEADGRIRVSVRLFRVSDGALLWAETFDERDTDIFALQDSISEKVASSLSLELNADEREKLRHRYTENIEAYNLYQKGRFFWNNRNGNDLRKSIELFNQAIALDSNYALAYSGLADTYVLLQFFSHTEKNDFFQKAKNAAEKALSLDKNLAEPHAALAMYKQLYEWDWEGAEAEFRLAIAANPNYATAYQWYGEFLTSMGRFDESIAELEKAIELDPLSLSTNTALAQPYLASGRYAEAIEKLKPALELDDQNFSLALLYMGRAFDGLGDHKQAIAQYEKNTSKPGGGGPYFTASLINSYARDGQKKEAEDMLNGLLNLAEKMPISNYVLARALAPLGYQEEALEKLEKAFEQRDGLLIILRTDRNFDELRELPRFHKILTAMKLND